jgi:hypothetical protein
VSGRWVLPVSTHPFVYCDVTCITAGAGNAVVLGFVPGRYEKCDCECFVSASVCDTRMCEDHGDIVYCVVCVCVMTVTVFLPLFEDLRRFAVFPFTRAASAALVYCQPHARCQHGVL